MRQKIKYKLVPIDWLATIAELDRDNSTHKTTQGQWIVIVELINNGKKAMIEVHANKADARSTGEPEAAELVA